jgi:hypothetical protein
LRCYSCQSCPSASLKALRRSTCFYTPRCAPFGTLALTVASTGRCNTGGTAHSGGGGGSSGKIAPGDQDLQGGWLPEATRYATTRLWWGILFFWLTDSCRYPNSLDRAGQWCGYGLEFSRGRRMCSYLVRDWTPWFCSTRVDLRFRRFVNTVQQHLTSNGGPGM